MSKTLFDIIKKNHIFFISMLIFWFIEYDSQQEMMPGINAPLDGTQNQEAHQHLNIHSRHHLSNAEDMDNDGQAMGAPNGLQK